MLCYYIPYYTAYFFWYILDVATEEGVYVAKMQLKKRGSDFDTLHDNEKAHSVCEIERPTARYQRDYSSSADQTG